MAGYQQTFVTNKEIQFLHIEGKINPAGIFTKEDKDASYFVMLRDSIPPDPQEDQGCNSGLRFST